MRIIHITDHFDGNSGRFVNIATKKLKERGHNVTIYTSDKLIDPIGQKDMGVKVRRFLGFIIGNGSWMAPKNIYPGLIFKLLFMRKPDIIHSYVLGSFASTISSYICWLRGIPLIIEADYNLLTKPGPFHFFDKFLPAHLAKTLTVFTNEQRIKICKDLHLSFDKVKVLPIGVEIKQLHSKKNKVPVILNVGNITPAKNIELLIDIARHLPEYEFIQVGSFYDKKYQIKILAQARSVPNLRFTGPMDYVEINKAYSNCDIYLQTSHYESFCISIIEALAMGKPVITTPIGIARDIIDNKNGYQFRKGDEAIRIIQTLLNNLKRLKQMSDIARITAERFDWVIIITKLEEIYK